MQPLIQVEDVVKRYGDRVALDRVSFVVESGEIVGLLGPNGAGKSTTLAILATVLRADSGRIAVGGCELPREAARARREIGFVPQREALYPPLSATENLRFFGQMQGLGRAELERIVPLALERVALASRAAEPIAQFSVGMRRRLNLACGILHRPRVILLDEPTVGVDPQSRERVFESVTALAGEGAAILYSTHAMEEAERLCRRIVLLDVGRVIAAGTPSELVASAGLRPAVRLRTERAVGAEVAAGIGELRHLAPGGRELVVEIEDSSAVPALLDAVNRQGAEILEMSLHQPNLADVFFALTGRALRDRDGGEPA